MSIPHSLLAAVLMSSAAPNKEASSSTFFPQTSAVAPLADTPNQWYRQVVLAAGVAAVVGTFVYALSGRREA